MPKVTDFSAMSCSISRSFDLLGQTWVPLIVRDLYCGVRRFDELQADLGIARAVLTTRLRNLVDAGIVRREAYTGQRDEYHLTEPGEDLVAPLMAVMAWGDRWLDDGDGPPMRLRHRECGHLTVPTVCCSACGGVLRGTNVAPEPGPGGSSGFGTALIGSRVGPGRPPSSGAADGGADAPGTLRR